MSDSKEPNKAEIDRITLKQQGGDKIMSVSEFLSINVVERTRLIFEKQVEFLDKEGNVLPSIDAVNSIIHDSPPWQPPS